MNKNLAITVGAMTCGAGLALSACGDEAPAPREPGTVTTVIVPGLASGPPIGGKQGVQPGTPSAGQPALVSGQPLQPGVQPGAVTGNQGGQPGVPAAGAAGAPANMVPTTPVGTGTTPVALPAAGIPIIPTPTGWVQGTDNAAGIQGAWYSYSDCTAASVDCTKNHLPAEGEFANIGGKMCTSGTTAHVMTEAEFATKWGAGIALDLAAMAGAAGVKGTWNAAAVAAAGISFDITFNAPGTVRVNLPTAAATAGAHSAEVKVAGPVSLKWADFAQAAWIKPPGRVPLDTSALNSIQFQVSAELLGPVTFDFCISNLTILQ